MWAGWGLCSGGQPAPSWPIFGRREHDPCQPSPGLSQRSNRAGGNSLCSSLCTAEGALRPRLLRTPGSSSSWREALAWSWQCPAGFPRRKQAVHPLFSLSRACLLTGVKTATHRSLLCSLPPVTQDKLFLCALISLSKKCGLSGCLP